jgi:tyrosyl-tRNA synthetase
VASLYEELTWRGLVADATDGVADALASGRITAYIGFDATANSLHVGHLLVLMALARLQRFGHSVIGIAGGGTGMIGDPSGKSQERVLQTLEQIERNVVGIRAQLAKFLDFDGEANSARIVNNIEWLGGLDLLSFLRDTGKHFTVNYMLQKESVNRRLESEEGISFTEFSYQLLQARDYLELFDRYGCTLQMGATDQWGNITAGIELIRKLRGQKVHGLVTPLLTTSSGVKFGKTEAGAVWLDPERTLPFRFYQFWLNTEDAVVIQYLKYFTYLDWDSIADLERSTEKSPERREAQRVLAAEVTRLVHGDDQVQRAERASSVMFREDITSLAADDVLAVFDDVPSTDVGAAEWGAEGIFVVDLLARSQLAPSKGEARRLVKSGGVYVNNRRVSDPEARLKREEAIEGRVFVLRRGQRQAHVVKIRS